MVVPYRLVPRGGGGGVVLRSLVGGDFSFGKPSVPLNTKHHLLSSPWPVGQRAGPRTEVESRSDHSDLFLASPQSSPWPCLK